ncbi:hypothetical protein EL06_28035 [Salmonella enterica subsp. diarizonae]|uniref:Uncharacterized protein n=1 Tax=Salmonella diarizonae TaxID=59204 RepID=A0A6C8Y4C5_SALDZ|nr:hypothetical protein [Salmonella enterica subsp. diarizonae]
MDGNDLFVWSDGSMVYRDDYYDLIDSFPVDDFEILYVGTPEYHDALDWCPDDDEGGPDDEYWPDND